MILLKREKKLHRLAESCVCVCVLYTPACTQVWDYLLDMAQGGCTFTWTARAFLDAQLQHLPSAAPHMLI